MVTWISWDVQVCAVTGEQSISTVCLILCKSVAELPKEKFQRFRQYFFTLLVKGRCRRGVSIVMEKLQQFFFRLPLSIAIRHRMVVSKSSFRFLVKSLSKLRTNGPGQAAISCIFPNNTCFTLSEKFMSETSKMYSFKGLRRIFSSICQSFFIKKRTGYAFFRTRFFWGFILYALT